MSYKHSITWKCPVVCICTLIKSCWHYGTKLMFSPLNKAPEWDRKVLWAVVFMPVHDDVLFCCSSGTGTVLIVVKEILFSSTRSDSLFLSAVSRWNDLLLLLLLITMAYPVATVSVWEHHCTVFVLWPIYSCCQVNTIWAWKFCTVTEQWQKQIQTCHWVIQHIFFLG